ncbi:hypothetical protein CcCBS67573_g09352 [Chytriomyces confervae]|uniref:F-box domain-containing protein n=1 Tax=Chytriomyces confervae TaxID=246404 RepID=A0A507E023_9FUNG|nr:hypothetical protein CcCBS67573_g09352 [Chytriomyces confervae]
MLTWSNVPYEIKELILQRLGFARDILNAGLTSKDTYAILTDDVFWRHTIERRFGTNSLPPDDTSAKQTFSTLALRAVQAQSQDLTGAWTTNIQYWQPRSIQYSISNQVLALNSVWWFEVNACFSVPSGRYRPYFRVAYDFHHYTDNFGALNLEHLKFQVQFGEEGSEERSATMTQFDETCSLPRCTWVRLYLPEIVVDPVHAFEEIKCSITDTASTLKRQFCVDLIGLERVFELEVDGARDAVLVKVEEEFHPV